MYAYSIAAWHFPRFTIETAHQWILGFVACDPVIGPRLENRCSRRCHARDDVVLAIGTTVCANHGIDAADASHDIRLIGAGSAEKRPARISRTKRRFCAQ